MYYLNVASFEFSFNISSPWEKKSILLKLSLIATWSFLLSRRRQGIYRLPTNSGATRDTLAAGALATGFTYSHLTGRQRPSLSRGQQSSALVWLWSRGRHSTRHVGRHDPALIKVHSTRWMVITPSQPIITPSQRINKSRQRGTCAGGEWKKGLQEKSLLLF